MTFPLGAVRAHPLRGLARRAVVLAAFATGCGPHAAATSSPATAGVGPAPAAHSATSIPTSQAELPNCSPAWLGLAPSGDDGWTSIDADRSAASRWLGVWTVGDPETCTFVIAVRRRGSEVQIHANQCHGPGLILTGGVRMTVDRLELSGHWTASTAQSALGVGSERPNEASGTVVSLGSPADPDDPDAQPESSEQEIQLVRRCK